MKRTPPSASRLALAPWLLLTLAFSACIPLAPLTPGTPGTQSPPSTPLPGITADQTTPFDPAAPSLTPVPTLAVDAAALRGVTLEVWHAFAGESYQIFNEQVGFFNATNEWGITVNPSGSGDYLTLYEAVQAAVEAGEVPQMVITLPEQALAWQADGLVTDLAAYLRDPRYGLSDEQMADFPTAFWAPPGAPAQRSVRLLFYNQTWAHELGFTLPPQTPEDFRQQACAANAAFKANADVQDDGFGGWVVDADWQTAYSWLLALGGSLYDGEGYTFPTAANQAALEFLKGLYADNCAWLTTDATPYDAFALRKALFVTGDLAELQAAGLAMTAAANTDEWMPIPFPGVEEPTAVAYGPSFIVMNSTPEGQLAAWLFARWVLSPENQAQWVEATGLLPLRYSTIQMVGPYRNASPRWEAAVGSLVLMESAPPLASWRKVRYVLADGLQYLFQVNLPPGEIPSLLESMQEMAAGLGGG